MKAAFQIVEAVPFSQPGGQALLSRKSREAEGDFEDQDSTVFCARCGDPQTNSLELEEGRGLGGSRAMSRKE